LENVDFQITTKDGFLVLDSSMVQQLLVQRGLSVRGLAKLADVSPNTALRVTHNEKIQLASARKIFDALEIADPRPFIQSSSTTQPVGSSATYHDDEVLGEWQVESMDTRSIELSNGLTFQRYKLIHRELPDTRAWGKCYDLTQLRTRDQTRVQEQLTRHPVVCRALRHCPRFPANERVVCNRDRSRFWVIDAWYAGPTLEDKLRYGPLSPSLLPRVMKQILEGLEALHQAAIIRRELAPRYVVLAEPNGEVLLTELELAKLLQGTISVSETWGEDPYRAPEVESEEIDHRVDFYSWSQILLHAATGVRPPAPAEPALLKQISLPPKVEAIAQRCLSASYTWRPKSAAEIRQAIQDWN
jgi:hypothetical protein